MKKLIFYSSLFVLSFLFINAQAQNVAIGVEGGISIPNLTAGSSGSTPLSTGYSSRLGPDFGINAEFKVSGLFSIQPQLEYSSQGGKKDGFQAFPNTQPPPTYLYATFNSEARMNYLMLPVLAKFGWDFKGSPLRFFVDAGPFVSLLMSAHQVTSGTSEVYAIIDGQKEPASPGPEPFGKTTDIKDQLHGTNYGIEGNVGLAYRFKKSYLYIEAGGNYGFINIQTVAEDGSNNTGAATVVIGYSFWLGK
jgi:hypothetical protein